MFDFSHGLNRPQPTLTGRLGLSKFLQPTPQKPLIGSLSRVVEHPHKATSFLFLTIHAGNTCCSFNWHLYKHHIHV